MGRGELLNLARSDPGEPGRGPLPAARPWRPRRCSMRNITSPRRNARPVMPPPPRAGPPRPAARTFTVRCVSCGRRFTVDRAPARCCACGGIAVA